MEKYYAKYGRYPYPRLSPACHTDTGGYSCNLTSCDNDNGVAPRGPTCVFAGYNNACQQTYDNSWAGLAAFLSPFMNGPLPNDPQSTTGWAKGWAVVVSGPDDNHQHYLIQASLEASGADQIYNQPGVMRGYIQVQFDPYGYNQTEDAYYYSNELTSNMTPTTLNQTCPGTNASDYSGIAWLDGVNCGDYYYVPDQVMHHTLCMGNVWIPPTYLGEPIRSDEDKQQPYGYFARLRCYNFNQVNVSNGRCCNPTDPNVNSPECAPAY